MSLVHNVGSVILERFLTDLAVSRRRHCIEESLRGKIWSYLVGIFFLSTDDSFFEFFPLEVNVLRIVVLS